jgi:hypothetical protein
MAMVSLTSCGGGEAPESLAPYHRSQMVRIDTSVVFKREHLGLIQHLARNDAGVIAASSHEVCRFAAGQTRCFSLPAGGEIPRVQLVGGTDPMTPLVTVASISNWSSSDIAGYDATGRQMWIRRDVVTPFSFGIIRRQGKPPLVAVIEKNAVVLLGFADGKVQEVVKRDCASVGGADLDGDGSSELLCLSRSGEVLQLLEQGSRRPVASSAGDDFVVARSVAGPDQVVVSDGVKLTRWTASAETTSDLELHDRPWLAEMASLHLVAAAVTPSATDPLLIVIFSGRGGWHRSVLLVYTAEGRLAYDAVIDGGVASVLPLANAEAFLLGGRDSVTRYDIHPVTVSR